MASITWTNTPFENIGDAHKTAVTMQLKPSEIINTGGMWNFQIIEGRKTLLLAQALSGGPVKERTLHEKLPLQDPEAPTFSDSDRLLVGPWTPSEHETLLAVIDHISKQYINPDNLRFFELLMFEDGGDEYQYYLDPQGQMYCRVLSRRK